jgi:hypothetical protein
MNLFETMRIAVRDSDKAFELAWVEDSTISPRLIKNEEYPYVVIEGYGQGDGGYQSVVQSFKTLDEAVEMVDAIIDGLVEHGEESKDERFHGFRDATFEGVEALGMDRSLGWVFSVVSVDNEQRRPV